MKGAGTGFGLEMETGVQPWIENVEGDSKLPSQTDILVVGGGIVGVCTAYFLAARGVAVVLCEKGQIGAEQSGRNWGWVRKQGGDPAELPLALESVRLWERMNAEVGAETGYRTCGSVSLATTEKDLAACVAWVESARDFLADLGTRVIGPRDLEALFPGSSQHYKGGLYTATDGRAEPALAAPAVALAARQRGALVFNQCAVRGLETAAGRVSAAVTEKGRIRCSAIVLAGGVWSRLFCQNMGVRLPQLKLRTSVMSIGPVCGAPETAALAPTFAFRRRLDGGYTLGTGFMNYVDVVPDSFRFVRDFWPTLRHEWSTFRIRGGRRFFQELLGPKRWSLDEVSPFERMRIFDPKPVESDLRDVITALCAKFPVFRNIEVREKWAAMIDVSPDAMPILSAVPQIGGYFVATGFSGHGFGNGPGAGRLMADLVTGSTPTVDPRPYRYTRFTDGPRPEYHARI